MRRALPALGLALLLLCGLASPAAAQTVLHLSETATIAVHPDELVCELRATASAPRAAEAQAGVNAMAADALARAGKVAGVRPATGDYSVWHGPRSATDHTDIWQAAQTIVLRGGDGAALLALVGELQARGLAVGELSWQLAPETARHAREQATAEAIKGLRGRADQAAGLLDLRFHSFREVRLDGARAVPAGPRMMKMAAAMPEPVAGAADLSVDATVEADVLLVAR